MIVSFRSKALRRFWEKDDPRGLNPRHVAKLSLILGMLEIAKTAEDMNAIGMDFHSLTGEKPQRWTVNGNWCVTFSFDDSDACALDYEDYH